MNRHACMAAAVIHLAASLLGAAGPGGAVVVKRWDFDQPGDLQGFSAGANVADLSVADGVLRFRTLNNDPYIYVPPVQAPLDGCVVRMAVRCPLATDNQVYWTTPEHPQFDEQQVINRFAPGGTEEFTVLEFPIGKPSSGGTQLTGFRIDPCGGPVGAVGEIDFVELVRIPALLEVNLAFDRHVVPVGEPAGLSVRVRQIDGWKDYTKREVQITGQPAKPIVASTQPAAAATAKLSFKEAGVTRARAGIAPAGGSPGYDLETSIVVRDRDSLPLIPGIRTERVRLDLVRAADGDAVGAAKFSASDGKGRWNLAGWLLPLVRLTVLDTNGRVVKREPALNVHAASEGWVRLEGQADDLPEWRLQVDISAPAAGDRIEVAATLTGPQDGQLLEFAAPSLRVDREPSVDPLDRFALFGGLEMLEPGWPSSSERAVGEKFAEKHTPHPYKVAVPIMAVEAGGLTTCMLWQPLAKWDDRNALPTATFASPNFIDEQPNHLMRLWVPGVPEHVEENQSYARRPYIMDGSQPLTLNYMLLAERDLPAMVAARRWFEVFGTPPAPPQAHGDRELYDLIAHSYGQTMYWPEQGGWTQHWFFPQGPGENPEMAAFLAGHAVETGQRKWVEKTGLRERSLVDVAGRLDSRLVSGEQQARALVASMRPDATWPFHNTDKIRKTTREFTNGRYDSLGEDGSTALGICAPAALGILRQARLSGDNELIEAGLKAVNALRQFRVPRGAQVWEVHKDIPDIRAAALAVEVFQIAYQLTGDRRYLEEAGYWAWTGVPFVYSWHVPAERRPGTFIGARDRNATDRRSMPLSEPYLSGNPQVTPYGTIPVMGPTFYVINWFGVLVQWCGLEWAQKVIELDADRPDPLLRTIADGVAASGLQQMMDKEPWIGLYPDAWLLEQNIAQPALIYPGLILACRQAQGRLPVWSKPWTRVLHGDGGNTRWHVSGWGRPVNLDPPGGNSWSASVEFLAGQPGELLLIGARRPTSVTVDDSLVERGDTQADRGWSYDSKRQALSLRFAHAGSTVRVSIEW